MKKYLLLTTAAVMLATSGAFAEPEEQAEPFGGDAGVSMNVGVEIARSMNAIALDELKFGRIILSDDNTAGLKLRLAKHSSGGMGGGSISVMTLTATEDSTADSTIVENLSKPVNAAFGTVCVEDSSATDIGGTVVEFANANGLKMDNFQIVDSYQVEELGNDVNGDPIADERTCKAGHYVLEVGADLIFRDTAPTSGQYQGSTTLYVSY